MTPGNISGKITSEILLLNGTVYWGKVNIQPGNLQQNAYVERFNRIVRYEWLAQYLFDTVGEVQDFAT